MECEEQGVPRHDIPWKWLIRELVFLKIDRNSSSEEVNEAFKREKIMEEVNEKFIGIEDQKPELTSVKCLINKIKIKV